MKRILVFGIGFAFFFITFGLFAPEVFAAPVFSDEFDTGGSTSLNFDSPSALTLDTSNDMLYVADTNNDRIQIFELVSGNTCPSGTDEVIDGVCFVDEFDTGGSTSLNFDSPSALTLDTSNDMLYVADTNNDRIQIFELVSGNTCPSGTDEVIDGVCFVDEFDTGGSTSLNFDSPSALTLDTSNDMLYVADTNNDRIQIFELVSGNTCPSGTDEVIDGVCFVDEFDTGGSTSLNFDSPSALTLDTSNDMLYVADTNNDRIQIFELVSGNTCPSGTDEVIDGVCFVDEFDTGGSTSLNFDSPSALTLDTSNDMLYVADTNNDRIQIFELVSGNTCPSGTDEVIDGVCFVDEFDTGGSTSLNFDSPSALTLDTSNDMLYVADTNNDRIQIFSLTATGDNVPERPTNLKASAASDTSIILTWAAPVPDEDVPDITGYKIEFRTGTDGFSTLVEDTGNTNTHFLHEGLERGDEYFYRIYAINSAGISSSSSTSSAEPQHTTVPSGLIATAVSPKAIKLSWNPPSDTFGLPITGYTIKREVIPDVYDDIAEVGRTPTSYTVSGLETDKKYTYVVIAKFPQGNTANSNSASATPREDSKDTTSPMATLPSEPRQLIAVPSSNQIKLSWSSPSSDGNSPITGYKIQMQTGSSAYSTIIENTKSTSTTYTHLNLSSQTTYNYKIFAINSVGTSRESVEISATTAEFTLQIKPLGQFTIDEGKTLSFTVGVSDETISNFEFSLGNGNPRGATINTQTGLFTWTPDELQGGGTYTFDIIVKNGSSQDTESVTITVSEVNAPEPEPQKTTPSFVDPNKDPQYYIDRYNKEPSYQEWFDTNFPEWTIHEAVGVPNPEPKAQPKTKPAFVDPNKDPQYYIDRYNKEPSYQEWFDTNFPEWTIYEAVGVEKQKVEEPQVGICGANTKLIDGICERVLDEEEEEGGGCLIATATYGSEMMPQVQQLRELRDIKLMSTNSGSSFISEFNQLYYSFSPTIADWERQNPIFKEAVKISLTPLLTSLSTLNLVSLDSEAEVLGYGISLILLNIGMYFVTPAIVIWKIKKHI